MRRLKQSEMPVPPGGATSFISLCEHGGHWCRRCQRYVVPVESDTGQNRTCPRCHGINLRWDPPVEGFHREEQFLTDPKFFHG